MKKRATIAVTAEELKRAFTVLSLALACNPEPDETVRETLARVFPPDKVEALTPRVTTLMFWLAAGEIDGLVGDDLPLGIPDIHPAVYEAASTGPVGADGLMSPVRFYREVARRMRSRQEPTR